MTFLRIFCLVSAVLATPCFRLVLPLRPTRKDYLLKKLKRNSSYIRSIITPHDQDGASVFDILQLKNREGADVYLTDGELMPPTLPKQWLQWDAFSYHLRRLGKDSMRHNVLVVTEGHGQESVEGRLVGFAVLCDYFDDNFFSLEDLEIDEFYQRRGLGQHLTKEAFALARKVNKQVRLLNIVSPRDAGVWLYFSSARDVGYKFVHADLASSSGTFVLPLEGLDKTGGAYKENDWNDDKLFSNFFSFTMGQHLAYTYSAADTVNNMHIIKLKDKEIRQIPKICWESLCPPYWTDIRSRQDKFECFFAFDPDSTDVLQGALLLKAGWEYTMESLYMPAAGNDQTLHTLLESMFSAAQHGKFRIVLKTSMVPDWNPVDMMAQTYRYAPDESSSSDEWRTYLRAQEGDSRKRKRRCEISMNCAGKKIHRKNGV